MPIGVFILHSLLYVLYENFISMFEKDAGETSYWVSLILVVGFLLLEILWGGSAGSDMTYDDYMFYNRIP